MISEKRLRNSRAELEKLESMRKWFTKRVRTVSLRKQPLEYAIWNLLTAHEYLHFYTQDGPDDIIIDKAKFGLMHALSWFHQGSEKRALFKLPDQLRTDEYKSARKVLELAITYAEFMAVYKCVNSGWASITLRDSNSLHARREGSEIAFDYLDYVVERDPSFRKIGEETAGLDSKQLENLIGSLRLENSGRLVFEESDAPYEITRELISNKLNALSKLPNSWSFRGISIEMFRDYWSWLTSLCSIHFNCHLWYVNNGKDSRRQYMVTPVLLFDRSTFAIKVRDALGVNNNEHCDTLISLFMYNPSLQNADPALQPLIPIGKDLIAISPSLILFNAHERNLMALLGKHHSVEYSKTTASFEMYHLDLLCCALKDHGLRVNTQVNLPNPLPDIDLSAYDSRTNTLLLAETKVTYSAAEVWEIENKAEAEKTAILQVKKIKQYTEENLPDVWLRCYPQIPFPSDIHVFYCAIMSGFVGTAKNQDDQIPLVEERIFLRELETRTNFRDVMGWISARRFVPIPGKDFEFREEPIRFGPYTVYWESFRAPDYFNHT